MAYVEHPNRINELRLLLGLRIADVARRCRATDSQIYKLEHSRTALTQDWMYRLAAALECAPLELLPDGGMLNPEEHETLVWLRGLDPATRARFAAVRRGDLAVPVMIEPAAAGAPQPEGAAARAAGSGEPKVFEMRVDHDGSYTLTAFYRPRQKPAAG
jgi:transcriptional regulator with XRE-family HTH domain